MSEISSGGWISPAPPPGAERPDSGSGFPTWWMRHKSYLNVVPEKVELSVVCLGYFTLFVNGHQVDDEPLTPSLTRLDRRAYRITYDITTFLKQGENCIGIWCSPGWYLSHQFDVHEGATPLLQVTADGFELDLDGWLVHESNRRITGKWCWDNFGGEEIDARLAKDNWNLTDCDTAGWSSARTVSAPSSKVVARTCPPNRIGETYDATRVRKLDDRLFEVDFGTCLTGWVSIPLPDVEAGEAVTLRFYDLPADNERNRDHSYNQVSIYRAAGDGSDVFTNLFNYAGFRYVTLEGLTEAPPLEGMKAFLIESDMDRVGHFRCSNDLYNRIHDLNAHTLRCLDLGSYSVDCPHRERFGYGADGQTALPAYLYMLDAHDFLRKWLTDWCDMYEPDSGFINLTAPTVHGQRSAPAWGGIVVPLAWELYVYYGDRSGIEEALPAIEGYIQHLQRAVEDGVMQMDVLGNPFHADWVPPRRGMDSGNVPDKPMRELFNSCYQIYLWQTYLKICDVLGRDELRAEAENCIAGLRDGIHREFYDDDKGLYLQPEQAYQAMPLMTGVVPDDLAEAVHQKLLDLIEDQGWHFDTGLPGTTLLLDYLIQSGEHDIIGKVFAQETYPGWGYMLAQGATAIWEQWNGYWSQIHSCFAGPAVWFYSGLAGINPSEDGPGFRTFNLSPAFVDEIDFVEASYAVKTGKIVSNWRYSDKLIIWEVVVPPDTKAVINLPTWAQDDLVINSQPFSESSTECERWRGDSCFSFGLGPGEYSLTLRR